MSVGLHGTLPFAPQPGAGADAVTKPSMDAFGRSNAVSDFENALRSATAPASGAGQPEGVQIAQLAEPAPVVATDAVPDVTAPGAVVAQPGVAPGAPVNGVNETEALDARARAAEGLELRTATAAEGPGTSILTGLEQLRSVFDGRFNSLGSKLEGTQMDVNQMMNLQAEVIQYSVLVDVSSKLAGKSTQAMDSLMKGQ